MRFTREDELVLPIRACRCPFCEEWVTIDGLGMLESMWMHEYDCRAIAKDYELAVTDDVGDEPGYQLPLAA